MNHNLKSSSFAGRILSAGDDGYDAARRGFYGGFDHRPALIAQVADAADIARAVTFARQEGLHVSVRSGGHSLAGHGVGDGSLAIDLSRMKGIQIDVAGRTAWAEAGLTAGEYTAAAGKHGLATGFGDTGSVGLGGITLGGGIGFLVRKYGLTIDELLAADIVTADGDVVRTDRNDHPDLFWAIRGGGGNFGVAVRFQFRLREVDTVTGGLLVLPATKGIIASFMAEALEAPEDLSTIANVMKAPPLPFLDAEYHGKVVILATLVHSGHPAEAGAALARFRSLATPIADLVKPLRYPELYPQEQGGFHPSAVGTTLFLDSVDTGMAEMALERLRTSKAQIAALQLRALGGAMARVGIHDTAFAHRASRIMANIGSLYGAPEEKADHTAWVGDFAADLRQGDQGAYVNFLGDEGADRVRAAYPGPTWDRLAAIKARYDPANTFRFNHNIPPAAARSADPA